MHSKATTIAGDGGNSETCSALGNQSDLETSSSKAVTEHPQGRFYLPGRRPRHDARSTISFLRPQASVSF